MSEISLVASEINNSLVRKTESLSRASSVSPRRSLSRNSYLDEATSTTSSSAKTSRLVYPKVGVKQALDDSSLHLNKIELLMGKPRSADALRKKQEKNSPEMPLFINESCEQRDNVRWYFRAYWYFYKSLVNDECIFSLIEGMMCWFFERF